MPATVLSVTEGASSIRYTIAGTILAEVEDRIAGIRRAAKEANGRVVFHRPHKDARGVYRAVGWVDGE